MTVELNVFGAWDYVVLVLVLLISASIGVYYRLTGGRQKTNREYLLADGSMAITPVAISLMASFMSAITLLGVASENYTYGAQFVVINISYGIFTALAAYMYLPVFFRLQATSAYEYLEKRFGKTARLSASICYTLQMVIYMGIVLYAPALALEALTGISITAAILSVGIVCTFYSSIGGMKAVLMTDVFQSILMFVAVFNVIIGEWVRTGSLGEIWRRAVEGGRINMWNFNPDPTVRHTWFSLIIGGGVTFLSLYGVNQTQIQRYLTLKSLNRAQKALWLNWPILTALSLSTSFAGLCIYSRYYNCDPVTAGYLSRSDQLMPYYVVETMGTVPGISGLFVAGIFSASLSTISAGVNSLAAITVEDYWKPIHLKLYGKPLSEKKSAVLTKVLAVVAGGLFIVLAFVAQYMGNLLQAALTIFGVVGGPLLGLFSLGMFTTHANEPGAVVGLVTGLGVALWSGFGTPRPTPERLPVSIEGCVNATTFLTTSSQPTLHIARNSGNSDYFWLYRISYLYNGVVGLIATMVVGIFVSYIIYCVRGRKEVQMDPNLFVPPLARRLEKRWGTLQNSSEVVSASAEKLTEVGYEKTKETCPP
ncbi:putative sodium-dependent multivitamin transporter [Agrilus planipennis]|uniref:Sodium-dependent multivitamin transporter n=1 Tax=Agrilus planipennis TaxID=224129 RepID=A0A7F5QXJ0_AGRPL|nr:putative sodium-dependent multivitamin transporter [Agrilus planipennis]XP_025829912.1 putative sodium-dependent multivitamin transporter [Agrilus planipennis]